MAHALRTINKWTYTMQLTIGISLTYSPKNLDVLMISYRHENAYFDVSADSYHRGTLAYSNKYWDIAIDKEVTGWKVYFGARVVE